MSDKVAEIQEKMKRDSAADWISGLWTTFNNQRQEKMSEWEEAKRFIFATDTTTTSNRNLPWSNTTTTPKLAQIRDNLHSNYLSALFPNDRWMSWEAYNKESANRDKANSIKAYMQNKLRQSNFRDTISRLLLDYIDYGNAFATVEYIERVNDTDLTNIIPSFIGPKLVRISPEDIVFNPLADSFEQSFKIVRSIKTTGELKKMAIDQPEYKFYEKVLENRNIARQVLSAYGKDDFNKAVSYTVDGFGNIQEYYMSDYVEILEFYGDYHDHDSGELHTNQIITIADRSIVARQVDIPTYSGRAPIAHTGWRKRPDNLWAMGPLDNLIGMQYRIDHLENIKADAMDLAIFPPLVIAGEVEQFTWGPGQEIHIDADGTVTELGKNLNPIIITNQEISMLEQKMELYAGAPREAAGIRTPGEKTAFEVQQLQNAAGRIFQAKITDFEVNLIEPVLNFMLEASHRNLNGTDVISTIDNDLGFQKFMEITKDDITAKGIIRPIGARHFAQRAQELQNLIGLFNTPLGQILGPHTSAKALTNYVNDSMDIAGYQIFKENVAILENKRTQSVANQANEALEAEARTPVEGLPVEGVS